MPTAKKLNQRDLSGKQVKPKTKCQFTQLQIIRQKDSSGSQSRCEDYNKTYSSNQSGAPSILPTQFKVQRQNSAADAFQSIINGCSLPASAMDSAKCQSRQTAKRSETMGLKNNYKTESAKHGTDARLSGKEHLLTSSLGKQTPSQFDFSNGLPECLRSNQQQPFATATDTGNNHALGQTKNLLDRNSMQSQAHQTSFNDFQLALASENNGAVLLSHSESSVAKLQVSDDRESDDDHKAYLHDFINSHPRDKDTSCEEKLKASGSSDDPYNVSQSILNANFPVIRDFEQFSKGKRQSEKTQKKQQFATRKHSYLQEQEAYGRQHYQGEGHLKLLKESQVYKGGQETAQRSEGSHLLLQSFLSTDPNQVCSQITVPSMSIQQQPSPVQSKSKLQSSQPPHSGLTYPNWKQTNPLESSQRSKNKLKNSSGLGSSHFKNSIKHNLHSLSQSKLLKMSNNSGAQSSFKLLSSTNGDEPLWTLSDEELTARKDVEFQKIDDFAADNQNEKSQKQHDRLTIQDAQANYPNTETDGSKDQMLRVQDILSPRDLVSVSEANRPSIDQMLPTRYSQLELDSQRQSSTRQTQNHLIMTPTQWSENYLARKQRQLDHHLCNGPGSHYDRSLVLPFQRERTASDIGMEQVIRQPSEEEQMHDHFFKNESTVQEEEYGPELNSREFTELQCAMTDTNASRIQEEHSVNNDSNLHQQASQQMSQHVSVMDGFEVDKERADQWLTNQDRLCPKVIADDTDDDDDDEGNEGDSCDY